MAWSLQIHSAHQCQSDFLVQPYEGWTGPSLRETKKINDPSRKSRKWVNQFQTHLAAMDSKRPIVFSCDFVAVWFSKISICPALLVYCHPIICHRHRQSSPQRHSTGKCVPHVCEETCFSQLLNCPFICELLQSNRILLKETWNPPSFLTQLEDIDMLWWAWWELSYTSSSWINWKDSYGLKFANEADSWPAAFWRCNKTCIYQYTHKCIHTIWHAHMTKVHTKRVKYRKL